jgi:hypothetical protein
LSLQRRLAQSELDGGGLQRDHQFLADAPQRTNIDMRQIGRGDDGLQLLDPRRHLVRKARVDLFEAVSENRAIGELDAGDVVAHIVKRGAADPGFATIRLALPDLISEPHGAIEQALRRKRHIAELVVKIVEMLDQRVRVVSDIGLTGAEQLGLDGVEAAIGIGPGIDLRVEFRDEARGEYFRTLPTGARREPCFLRARQIFRGCPLAQIARAGQRRSDSLNRVGPIVLSRVVERRGLCRARVDGESQEEAQHHSLADHLPTPGARSRKRSRGTKRRDTARRGATNRNDEKRRAILSTYYAIL